MSPDRAFRRARRIAESVGDAVAVEVGGDLAIVCDTYYALCDAEKLVASQNDSIDVYSSDQVESCDTCGAYESRTGTGMLPPGWAEQEDSNGDLVGFLCPEHAGTR